MAAPAALAGPVTPDAQGCFRAEATGAAAFFGEDGSPLAIATLPPGCWPVLHVRTGTRHSLYFIYFLSPVLHRWSLGADLRRQSGEPAAPAELAEALDLLPPGTSEMERHLRARVARSPTIRTAPPDAPGAQGGLSLFIALERLAARAAADPATPLHEPAMDLLRTAPEGVGPTTLATLMATPAAYSGKIAILGPARARRTLHWTPATPSPLRSGLAAAGAMLDALNAGLPPPRRFHLGGFAEIHPVWFTLLPAQAELHLSRALFAAPAPAPALVDDRLVHALHRMRPHLLRLRDHPACPPALTFDCTDEADGATIAFDAPAGRNAPLIPDLYVLEHANLHPSPEPLPGPSFLDAFMARKPALFWRGTTTGGLPGGTIDALQANPRVRACRHILQALGPDGSDVRISRIHGIQPALEPAARAYLAEAGILGDEVPETAFGEHRMVLDLPGNGAAWGTFRKYLMGCLVIRPRHARELLYYRLQQHRVHFIEAEPDLSDLPAIVAWAHANPEQAAAIAYAGRELMLHYVRLLPRHFIDTCLAPHSPGNPQ